MTHKTARYPLLQTHSPPPAAGTAALRKSHQRRSAVTASRFAPVGREGRARPVPGRTSSSRSHLRPQEEASMSRTTCDPTRRSPNQRETWTTGWIPCGRSLYEGHTHCQSVGPVAKIRSSHHLVHSSSVAARQTLGCREGGGSSSSVPVSLLHRRVAGPTSQPRA